MSHRFKSIADESARAYVLRWAESRVPEARSLELDSLTPATLSLLSHLETESAANLRAASELDAPKYEAEVQLIRMARALLGYHSVDASTLEGAQEARAYQKVYHNAQQSHWYAIDCLRRPSARPYASAWEGDLAAA